MLFIGKVEGALAVPDEMERRGVMDGIGSISFLSEWGSLAMLDDTSDMLEAHR